MSTDLEDAKAYSSGHPVLSHFGLEYVLHDANSDILNRPDIKFTCDLITEFELIAKLYIS